MAEMMEISLKNYLFREDTALPGEEPSYIVITDEYEPLYFTDSEKCLIKWINKWLNKPQFKPKSRKPISFPHYTSLLENGIRVYELKESFNHYAHHILPLEIIDGELEYPSRKCVFYKQCVCYGLCGKVYWLWKTKVLSELHEVLQIRKWKQRVLSELKAKV